MSDAAAPRFHLSLEGIHPMTTRFVILLAAAFVAAPIAVSAATPTTSPHSASAPVAASAVSSEHDGWPATPAGVLARDWVSAFGAGDDSMAACLNRVLPAESLAKRPMSERLVTYRRMHDELGTLTFFAVDRQSADELTVTLLAADLSKHKFIFTLQPDAPHRLLSIKTIQGGHGSFPGLGWLHH